MEIGPVPGIRAFSAVKAPPADTQLSAIFDIDALSKTGDGAVKALRKAAGAEEDEDDDLTLAADGEPAGELPSRVSFFA